MEDKKMNTVEGAAISDDALEAVSGGVQWIQFGNFGATTQGALTRVKVVDGSSCSSCGGVIGIVGLAHDGTTCVKCEKCATVILAPYRGDAVEVI